MLRILPDILAGFSKSHRRLSMNPAENVLLHEGIRSSVRRCVAPLLAMLFVLATMAAMSTLANAQVRFGSILGTVSDSTGASLANATVTITNLGTNQTRSAKTTSAGTYSVPPAYTGWMWRSRASSDSLKTESKCRLIWLLVSMRSCRSAVLRKAFSSRARRLPCRRIALL